MSGRKLPLPLGPMPGRVRNEHYLLSCTQQRTMALECIVVEPGDLIGGEQDGPYVALELDDRVCDERLRVFIVDVLDSVPKGCRCTHASGIIRRSRYDVRIVPRFLPHATMKEYFRGFPET